MIMLSLFFDYEDGSDIPPKHKQTSSELHGVISQKSKLFTFRIRLNKTKFKLCLIAYFVVLVQTVEDKGHISSR
jgi:hypothetical protein